MPLKKEPKNIKFSDKIEIKEFERPNWVTNRLASKSYWKNKNKEFDEERKMARKETKEIHSELIKIKDYTPENMFINKEKSKRELVRKELAGSYENPKWLSESYVPTWQKATQSYETLASTSTSSSSPWSDKKQKSDWKKEQQKNIRDEIQKEMKYNNDPFQSPFSH